MNQPKLSICIPTYNRADYLIRTLNLLKNQLNSDVQLVISDNHSTDTTRKKIENFKKNNSFLNIKICHQEKNLGFDKNVLSVINLADGQYCWLLSDDDFIIYNSIQRILKKIEEMPDTALFLINYSRFDVNQKKITAKKMINLKNDVAYTDFNSFYFTKTSRSYFYILGTNIITMSVNVFKRSYWLDAEKTLHNFVGLNFIHVFVLTKSISLHPKIYFIAQPMLQYSCNNHREWGNDIWRDYNKYFLPHLTQCGFDKEKINTLQNSRFNRTTIKEHFFTFLGTIIRIPFVRSVYALIRKK
jgi:abequosyltransferase